MSIQRYPYVFMTLAVWYMFFNSIFLPDGLLYTTLLTPFFFLYALKNGTIKWYIPVLIICLIYAGLQYPYIDYPSAYLISFILLQSVAMYTIIAYQAIRAYIDQTPVFKILASVNLGLLIVSLIVYFIPTFKEVFWYTIPISPGVPIVPRLKMLTYEASYYSMIIFPIFFYYFLTFTLLRKQVGILFFSLCLSLLLSFSLGVIGAIAITCFLLLLMYPIITLQNLPRYTLLYILLACVIAVSMLIFFYPENPLFLRLANILHGKDTSARGRTYEAFYIAYRTASMKSIFWGVGLGQFKEVFRDYVIQYYYYSNIPQTIRIPNTVAETLNIFGISGLAIRTLLILYFFIKTKVWTNYYRMGVFIFIGIYQFTGSFLYNIAEYTLWCLAFCPGILPQFEIKNLSKHSTLSK